MQSSLKNRQKSRIGVDKPIGPMLNQHVVSERRGGGGIRQWD